MTGVPLATIQMTYDELDALGDVLDQACSWENTVKRWSMLNSLRTAVREAQAALTIVRHER